MARQQHRARFPDNSRSSTEIPASCSNVSREACHNNTTNHKRTLTPHQQMCCQMLTSQRKPHGVRTASGNTHNALSTRCLCFSVENSADHHHTEHCLCRVGGDTAHQENAARKSCFCKFKKLMLNTSCDCDGAAIGEGRDCTCSFPKDHLSHHCA